MKTTFLTTMLLALSLAAEAQTARKQTVNITPDGKANMVVYHAQRPTGRAVVCCPGGGYSHLSMQSEGHEWATWFNERGITFCVLTYRMPSGDRTIPLGDAQKAICTVRDSAVQWAVNPYDVGIMGFSAGGHLASAVSTHSPFASRPNFSILFYPVISMNQRETHKGSCLNFLGEEGAKDEKLVKEWSSQNAVRSHLTPPAVVFSASDDRAVPVLTNGLAYYSAMRRAGNDCALYVYPTGGHGFGFRTNFVYHNQMLGDLSSWLEHHRSPKADAVRVACIGNSITHGSGIDMQEHRGYPAQLQTLLGNGYYVRNFGVGGRTMLKKGDRPYMQELAWADAQAFQPNIVLIKLGTNDSKDYNWNPHKADYPKDMQAMIDTLQALPSKPRIFLCTPIKAFRDKWGITDSVIVNEVIPAIRQVAKKNKLPVIDLHPVVTDPHDMTSDMIHPNEKGAHKMAEEVAAQILRREKR
jgi:acetyl esterase/lipase